MRFRLATSAFGMFLLVNVGQPALAEPDVIVFWDQSIATAVNNFLMIDEICQPSPYALYRQTCVSNELNVTLERSPFEKLTFLDHIALFVYKHRNLNATQELMQGIKFKVGANLSNVYQQEAKLEARLGVRW
jgi:hypothetical protein